MTLGEKRKLTCRHAGFRDSHLAGECLSLSKKKSQKPYRDLEVESVVARYLSGDGRAFLELQRYINPVIRTILKSKKCSRADYEDMTQECWLDFLKNLPKWNPERGTLKNFLYACFSNRVIVCLYRSKSDELQLTEEQIENLVEEETPHPCHDLHVALPTRFTLPGEKYIMQNVCTAVYLKIYDTNRLRMLSNMHKMTGLTRERVGFLMDYAVYAIRRHCIENEWRTET